MYGAQSMSVLFTFITLLIKIKLDLIIIVYRFKKTVPNQIVLTLFELQTQTRNFIGI